MPDMIHHALVLNFHQPSGNLDYLLENNEWEAKEILWAMDRMPRSLWGYEDVARVNISLSGTLLETLADPAFQRRTYGIVKCGDLLWYLQNTALFEILGTGYYHPVMPLIPNADWSEHCERWLGIGRHLFARSHFGGFWPPEMGFCMEMIPLLNKCGYRYVLVDSNYVEPIDPMRWEELRYRPHFARYENEEIIVIVRDREISDAQESGMDWGWFAKEVNDRTKWCDFPPLVTTCSDGENGGWFRNTNDKGNFWEHFHKNYLSKVRALECTIHPTFLTDYLDRYGAKGRVKVNTGAWNTGWHHGVGFIQWTGSYRQKEGLRRIAKVSEYFHTLWRRIFESDNYVHLYSLLKEAHWHLLRAETSCNFYWGEAWVEKCHLDLNVVIGYLEQISKKIGIPSKSLPKVVSEGNN